MAGDGGDNALRGSHLGRGPGGDRVRGAGEEAPPPLQAGRAMKRDRREYQRDYYVQHRGRIRAQQRDWYLAHAAQERRRSLEHYAAHRERRISQHAEWLRDNPNWRREWRAANREKDREYVKRRRARKLGSGGSHTHEEFEALCSANGWRCWYCGVRAPLTEDHIVSLVCGGRDDIENVLPSCRQCNGSKGKSSADDFLIRMARAA